MPEEEGRMKDMWQLQQDSLIDLINENFHFYFKGIIVCTIEFGGEKKRCNAVTYTLT